MSTATLVGPQLRSELGDFSSIICFKALANGLEEALGEKAALIATIAAGRVRGKNLATELGLAGTTPSLDLATQLMQKALGPDGTKLCLIDRIEEVENGYRVYCHETICSSGEAQGSSRTMSFTLGAIQGAIESMMGKRLRGTQVESVLRGGSHDVVELSILG
jgi:hypothetical protein